MTFPSATIDTLAKSAWNGIKFKGTRWTGLFIREAATSQETGASKAPFTAVVYLVVLVQTSSAAEIPVFIRCALGESFRQSAHIFCSSVLHESSSDTMSWNSQFKGFYAG